MSHGSSDFKMYNAFGHFYLRSGWLPFMEWVAKSKSSDISRFANGKTNDLIIVLLKNLNEQLKVITCCSFRV